MIAANDQPGWTEWAPEKGRLTNGPAGRISHVRLRSGKEVEVGQRRIGQELAFTHVGSSNDIVAYRVAGA